MNELLFLSHRIPYPPNKGDKIRSYHVLRYLAERYRVHLAAFADDAADLAHVPTLEQVCESVCIVPLNVTRARLRSATGFLRGLPLGVPYFEDARMRKYVRTLSERRTIASVFVFSSTMAQYAEGFGDARRVLDMCDIDSEKWHQYAERRPWPMSWVYEREARELGAYERECARTFDATLLASRAEAGWLRRAAPHVAEKIHELRNGVDVHYFDPSLPCDNPFAANEEPIVFTGAMDYWANVDAVSWFVKEAFEAVRSKRPRARFYIVGSRPVERVRALARVQGVTVTGTVPDVRPYLRHARAVVAPLRVARGIQNKVLEALAMARPVVATPAALEGLDFKPVPATTIANDAAEFADAVVATLAGSSSQEAPGNAGRKYVCDHYAWESSLAPLSALIDGGPAETGSRRALA
jgi:sugar transferase (PEP-CTERM/EpsH1 system associated)